MACKCLEYQCLGIDYDPCSNNVQLPLLADETGTWVVQIEFSQKWIRLNIEVAEGEPIHLPNVLNEHYTHTIRLLNSSKEVFNNTCYSLVTDTLTNNAEN